MRDRVVPRDELVAGDVRIRTVFVGVSLEGLQQELVALRLSPNVPPSVRHELLIAGQVLLSGYFFYELFATSIHHAKIACEVALREATLNRVRFPLALTRKGATQTVLVRPAHETFFDHLGGGWKLSSGATPPATFGRLVQWAAAEGVICAGSKFWWENSPTLRNSFAHGSEMVLDPGSALGVLSAVVEEINRLFPDPATTT